MEPSKDSRLENLKQLEQLRSSVAPALHDFRNFWYLGNRFRYLAHASYVNAEYRSPTLNIGANGFRGDAFTPKNTSTRKRVGFFGASGMLCIPNIGDAGSISAVTGTALRARGVDVDTMNFGVMCYLVKHEMNLLIRILSEYDLDAVVLFSGYNDAYTAAMGELWDYRDISEIFDEALSPYREDIGFPLKKALKNLTRKLGKLPFYFRGGIESHLKARHAKRRFDAHEPLPLYDVSRKIYLFYLNQIISACAYANVPLIYVHQPSIWSTSKQLSSYEQLVFETLPEFGFNEHRRAGRIDRFKEHYQSQHVESLAYAEKQGILHIDLEACYASIPSDISVFYDYCHLTDSGIDIFSELLADTIVSCLKE